MCTGLSVVLSGVSVVGSDGRGGAFLVAHVVGVLFMMSGALVIVARLSGVVLSGGCRGVLMVSGLLFVVLVIVAPISAAVGVVLRWSFGVLVVWSFGCPQIVGACVVVLSWSLMLSGGVAARRGWWSVSWSLMVSGCC